MADTKLEDLRARLDAEADALLAALIPEARHQAEAWAARALTNPERRPLLVEAYLEGHAAGVEAGRVKAARLLQAWLRVTDEGDRR